jgi:hypothetical protein
MLNRYYLLVVIKKKRGSTWNLVILTKLLTIQQIIFFLFRFCIKERKRTSNDLQNTTQKTKN